MQNRLPARTHNTVVTSSHVVLCVFALLFVPTVTGWTYFHLPLHIGLSYTDTAQSTSQMFQVVDQTNFDSGAGTLVMADIDMCLTHFTVYMKAKNALAAVDGVAMIYEGDTLKFTSSYQSVPCCDNANWAPFNISISPCFPMYDGTTYLLVMYIPNGHSGQSWYMRFVQTPTNIAPAKSTGLFQVHDGGLQEINNIQDDLAFSTQSMLFGPPGQLSAPTFSKTTIDLLTVEWDTVLAAPGVDYFILTDGSANNIWYNGTDMQFSINSSLAFHTDYSFRVYAVNAKGSGTPSDIATTQVTPTCMTPENNILPSYCPSIPKFELKQGNPGQSVIPVFPVNYGESGNPGSRAGSGFVADPNGNLWLFGGVMDDGSEPMNDVWQYNTQSQKWIWVAGSATYNSQGDATHPAARYGHAFWYGQDGHLWAYGGYSDTDALSDLWAFNLTSSEWTYITGSDPNGPGQFNSVGTTGLPGSKYWAAYWTVGDGLYIFGGSGVDVGFQTGDMNDMWVFNITTLHWTWLGGSMHNGEGSSVPASIGWVGFPGSRQFASFSTDKFGGLWLYGGYHYDAYSDLWVYNITTNEWTWMGGTNEDISYPSAVRGTGTPGKRMGAAMWNDQAGNPVLYSASPFLYSLLLNDVWVFSVATKEWLWMASAPNQGLYATSGSNTTLFPAARSVAQYCTDSVGQMWLFGGLSAICSVNDLINDVWVLNGVTPHVVSIQPNIISEQGQVITVTGEFFFAPTTATFTFNGKTQNGSIVFSNTTCVVIDAVAGSGGVGHTLTLSAAGTTVTVPIKYTEPVVSPSHELHGTVNYMTIRGSRINPTNVRVELTQTTTPASNKAARYASNPHNNNNQQQATTTTSDCLILQASSTEIVCSTVGLLAGSVSAVVYSNGYPTRPQVIAVIAPTSDSPCSSPSGTLDYYQTDMCNCWSGYAPSSPSFSDCNQHAKCAQNMLAHTNEIETANSPSRPTSKFEKDTLTLTQTVPIVLNRRGYWVGFQVPKLNSTLPPLEAGTKGADTCNYPGPLWEKKLNQLDCVDVYTVSMPWSQNKFCGFVQDLVESTTEWAIYKSVVVSRYVEIYSMDGKKFQKLSSYSHLVSVKFLTQKAFSSNTLSVYIADSTVAGFVSVQLTSDAVYDVASGNVLVSFLTAVAWPYTLNIDNSHLVGVVPAHTGLVADIANMEHDSIGGKCDNEQDSVCTQKWYTRINTAENCDISGVYTFEDTLLCRDGNNSCPDSVTPVQYYIRIKQTDLCAGEAISATEQQSIALMPFFDADMATESNTFQTGDMVYWKVEVLNPQGTIDKIEFNRISLEVLLGDGSTSDILYDTGALTSSGAATELQFKNIDTMVGAGKIAVLTFQHRFFRSALPNTVGQLSTEGLSIELRTIVVVDLYYHGNQKRTTTTTKTKPSQTLAKDHVIQVVANSVEEELVKSNGKPTEGSTSLENTASFVSMSIVLVAFVVIIQIVL